MPRARNIKPSFFTNDALVELGPFTRLLFIGLWTLADREGRVEDRPRRVKMNVFPADDVDVDAMLDELARSNFIERYEVGGIRVIQVVNFLKHQKPHHRETPSNLPPNQAPTEKAQPRNGQGTDEAQPRRVPAALNPSSLNPSCLNADTQAEPGLGAPGGGETPKAEAHAPPTLSGKACVALKAAGVQSVNPSHPQLAQLLSSGVTPKQLGDLAAEISESKGHPPKFAYVLAAMLGRLQDAIAQPAGPINGKRLPYPAEFIGWERDNDKAIGLSRFLGMGDGNSTDSWESLRGKMRVKLERETRQTA